MGRLTSVSWQYSSHHLTERRHSGDMMAHNSPRPLDWRQADVSSSYGGGLDVIPQSEVGKIVCRSRWDLNSLSRFDHQATPSSPSASTRGAGSRVGRLTFKVRLRVVMRLKRDIVLTVRVTLLVMQEVTGLPPRKRTHHMVDPTGHSSSLMSQTMALPL